MGFRGLTSFGDIEEAGYSKIRNHGMIANNRSAALVSMNGTIDWGSLPNFNSPPIFSSILDKNKGGYFSIYPIDTDDLFVHQSYKEFTNILMTDFIRHNKTILRITDFLPASEYTTISFPEIHRLLETQSEDVDVSIRFKPIINYGRDDVHIDKRKYGYIYKGKESSVGLVAGFELKKRNDEINVDITLGKRASEWIITLYGVNHLDRISDYKSYRRLEETVFYWQKWSNMSSYNGAYDSDVNRSALTLKGLFYEPTGLMVAAPTTSFPESIGGERNWDYRFTWIRDTAYVVEAMSMIGYKREATKFLYDMMETIQKDKRIRTIYSINGDGNLEEMELDYEGYLGSSPVRIGNKASDQLQIDQYGSIINAIYYLSKIGGIINSYLWDFVGETLDNISHLWNYPDSSIWEFRTEPRHYVYSKLMCWVAYTRAIELGNDQGFSAPYRKWKVVADEIKKDIITKGFNKETNSFSQYYGSEETDASLLRMPLVGFLPVTDNRIKGTIAKIEKDLMVRDYLFKRYTEDDGLRGEDNAFLLLSFWYVENLILMKRYNKAKEVFDSLLDRANHLGLFSEEIDFSTNDLIGNFPQAITHLGVIRSAIMLNEFLKKSNGKERSDYKLESKISYKSN